MTWWTAGNYGIAARGKSKAPGLSREENLTPHQ
jgi:hypothetical protein